MYTSEYDKVLIPKIIKETYPDLSDEEVEAVRQHIVVDSVIKNGTIEEVGDKRFIRMADSFVNIDDIEHLTNNQMFRVSSIDTSAILC